MGTRNPERALRMTDMFRRGASAADIAERFGVQRPAVYRALRRTGALPPYRDRTRLGAGPTGRNAANVRREKPFICLGVRVDRDPCPRCGQNPEHGDCGHDRSSRLSVAQ